MEGDEKKLEDVNEELEQKELGSKRVKARIVHIGFSAASVALPLERVIPQRPIIKEVVDMGVMMLSLAANLPGRKTSVYRPKRCLHSSADTMGKAATEAWAAWGIKVGHVKHSSKQAKMAKDKTVHGNMNQSEMVLRSQIEAWSKWNIDARNIKHRLCDQIQHVNMTYSEKVQAYFERMVPPPMLSIDILKKSRPNLAATTARAVAYPLRNALSLPAGLDLPKSSQ